MLRIFYGDGSVMLLKNVFKMWIADVGGKQYLLALPVFKGTLVECLADFLQQIRNHFVFLQPPNAKNSGVNILFSAKWRSGGIE